MIPKLEVFCLLACMFFHCRVFAELDVQLLEQKWPGECENAALPSLEKYEALVKELCDKRVELAQMEQRYKGQLTVEKHLVEKFKSMQMENNQWRENCDLRVRLIELNATSHSNALLTKLQKKSRAKIQATESQLLHLTTGFYYISPEKQKENWFSAARFCKYQGLELASIETKEENDELLKAIANTKDYFWLSGSDLGSDGTFYWSATGEPLGLFQPWQKGQPDNYNGNEHCLQFWNGHLWNDNLCELKFRFICEFVE